MGRFARLSSLALLVSILGLVTCSLPPVSEREQAACGQLMLMPANLPPGQVGTAYDETLTVKGGTGPYTFMVSAGTLPPGLSLSSSGTISGTPTAAGSYMFTVEVTDSMACMGNHRYTLLIAPGTCPAITVNPATLPDGQVGTVYTQTLTAVGGVPPYSFAVTAGALPAGLTLSTAGVISGTPTGAATYDFTVTVTDVRGCTGSRAYSIVIAPTACPTISVDPPLLADGTVGVPYSAMLSASGGTGPYAFAVTSGTLPDGLGLSSAGALSGTPTAAGAFSFTVTATDANACSGSRGYTVTISPPACPAIVPQPADLPDGTVGTPYSQTITATGGAAPYSFAVTTGSPPPGITLDAGGALSGTPTSEGMFQFTVTATDANGCTGSHAYTLTIGPSACPTVTVAPATLPDGTAGTAYDQMLTASGGTGPYTFAVTAGALPGGLSLAADGTLSGTPAAAGSFTFTATATDAAACAGSQAYTLTIQPPACPAVTLTASLPDGTVDVVYSQAIAGSGGTGPYTFAVTTGGLPPGLTLASDGTVSGTPTADGSFGFTVTATDAVGCSGSQAYTVSIAAAQGPPDAGPGAPDAAVAEPDAAVAEPDAAVAQADAATGGAADAKVAAADANVAAADAATGGGMDAAGGDARPDARPAADASTTATGEKTGCSCRVGGTAPPAPRGGLLLGGGLLGLLLLRRRTR
jgi:large repetitive protein